MIEEDIVDIEIKLLLEGIYKIYDYDFRDYGEASIKRRVIHWLNESEFETFSAAQYKILRDKNIFNNFLNSVTVNVSEMFRDPHFFISLRSGVIPYLKTYPFIKIWHAGCASGEEAYSMAILLNEEGLKGRYRIYATDINNDILKKAADAIYPVADIQKFTRNYQLSGGKNSFSDYYTAKYDHAVISSELKENIVFAAHNLTVDTNFGDMNMILCRNVLIYFKSNLKERVLKLFDKSLVSGGYLCLGSKESLEQRQIADRFEQILPKMQIYRKKYGI